MTPHEDLLYERETVIQFNELEPEANVWSASANFQRKMAKLGVEPTKTAGRERGEHSAWYKVPKSWVRLRPPVQRQLSEETRQAMSDRAHTMFSKRLPPETRQAIEPDGVKTAPETASESENKNPIA